MTSIATIFVTLLLLLLGAGAKTVGTSTGAPNQVALRPPAGLTAAQKARFRAGEAVAESSGCEGCHKIGDDGNDGPGPPLTHIGSALRPGMISAALKNPTAPMPSFANLAETSPKRFHELVQFLSMLQ